MGTYLDLSKTYILKFNIFLRYTLFKIQRHLYFNILKTPSCNLVYKAAFKNQVIYLYEIISPDI